MKAYPAAPVMRIVLFFGGFAVASVSVYTGDAMVRTERQCVRNLDEYPALR